MNPACRRRLCAGLLWIGAGLAAHAAEGAKAEPARVNEAGRTHVLFMGANLSVQQGKKFYTVEDVDGSEFVIHIKGEKKFIRTRLSANGLKVSSELKLSPVSVTLDALEGGPGYTPARDPRHKFNARSGAQGGAEAVRDWSEYKQAEAEISLVAAKAGDGALVRQYEDIIDAEKVSQGVVNQQLGSTDFVSIPNMANELAKELDEGNYDLVDVSFKISSPVPLDDPYMVVLVEFQLRDAKPGQTSMMIHAKALDPIDAKPKYIRVREGGMPIGFKYLRHEVHIFNRGQEVATNASSKRVELSAEEARQYVLLDYFAAHKDATTPAMAVPGCLPPAVRVGLSPDQLQQVCFVRVGKDGAMQGVYVDEGASLPIPDQKLTAALAGAFFKPALAKGKPMEGVVRVRLADLTL